LVGLEEHAAATAVQLTKDLKPRQPRPCGCFPLRRRGLGSRRMFLGTVADAEPAAAGGGGVRGRYRRWIVRFARRRGPGVVLCPQSAGDGKEGVLTEDRKVKFS